jgi:DNA polymerase elongation subunit (family B)
MLAELRRFRLTAKQAVKQAATDAERHYFDALQQVFKVLINSFYGYLGAAQHNFSDLEAAAEVTRLGRVTIRNMMDFLLAEGARPVEVDTDGIYFKPPEECKTEEAELALVQRISGQLPVGIEVELDGRYQAMFAYKTKNYALLRYDGTIILKGSGLRSRGVEPYLREFMRDVISLLLAGKSRMVERLYEQYISRLRSRGLDAAWVARSETLNESTESYQVKLRSGKRNRSAAFEIALASGKPHHSGDRVSYYVSGSGKDATAYEACRPLAAYNPEHPDINVMYYIEKLRHVLKRFDPFLPQEPTLFDL